MGLVQIAAIDTRLEQSAQGCSSTIGTVTVSRRVETQRSLVVGEPMGATFREQYPTICWFKQFCPTIHCPFSLVGLVNIGLLCVEDKSLKVSLTFTHIRKHLLALMEMTLSLDTRF